MDYFAVNSSSLPTIRAYSKGEAFSLQFEGSIDEKALELFLLQAYVQHTADQIKVWMRCSP